MAAYAWTPSALTWLHVNHLINGLHKQISWKNCLYADNLYFTLAIENPTGSFGICLECKFLVVKVTAVWAFNSQVECIVLYKRDKVHLTSIKYSKGACM